MPPTPDQSGPQDYSPLNPFRPVNWRWERAGYLLRTNGRVSRRKDDRWVYRVHAYRRAWQACTQGPDYTALAEAYPAMYWAHQLYLGRDDPQRRLNAHALEARLLAGQDPGTIATRMRLLAPRAIEAYGSAFFDVADCLDATDYLTFSVLGAAVYQGLQERHYDLLWKLFALWGGPYVIDEMLSALGRPVKPQDVNEVGAFIEDTVKRQLGRKAAIAGVVMPVNGFTATQILEQYNQMVATERKGSGGAAAAQATIMSGVGVMLTSLPFSVAGRTSAELGRTPAVGAPGLALFDESAVEASGPELLQLGMGVDVRPESRPFPPPPDRPAASDHA